MSPTDAESSWDSLVVHTCNGGFQPERHRTVIDQRHLHVGPEYARGYLPVGASRPLQEMVTKAPCLIGSRSGAEARPGAFVGVGGKGELRNQQQLSPDVAQRQVHLALLIGKDPVRQDPLQQPV